VQQCELCEQIVWKKNKNPKDQQCEQFLYKKMEVKLK
jgi:hypothetical protein